MPTASPHPCGHGCPVLVPAGQGRCPIHSPNVSKGWRQDTQRIRGRRLQTLRAQLFASEPMCRLCTQAGRLAVATIRDHITPLAEGGTDALENIQPLCQRCSDAKTETESRRARRGGL